VADLVRQWPARRLDTEQGELTQGLPVRLRLQRPQVTAEIELGDDGRIWPSDEALARWRAAAQGGQAVVLYE
jgi:DNA polymerase-3 subunit alpha